VALENASKNFPDFGANILRRFMRRNISCKSTGRPSIVDFLHVTKLLPEQ
jgi:hypothetical protein